MKSIEKIFYLFSGGLIASALAYESLKLAFGFSIVLGIILLICFTINQCVEYFEWAEAIKEFAEELEDEITEFFER